MLKTKILFIVTGLLSSVACLFGQNMDQLVSLYYRGESLEYVLKDMTRTYDLAFVYSRDYIPYNHEVHLAVKRYPLHLALDDIFKGTAIEYKMIAGQIVLRENDRLKEELAAEAWRIQQEEAIAQHLESREEAVDYLPAKKGQPVLESEEKIVAMPVPESIRYEDEYWIRKHNFQFKSRINIYPDNESGEDVNNFSLNLLWGGNEGLDGVELGGVANFIETDVTGIQLAGVGNAVGGDVKGTQIAGIANLVQNNTSGVQISSLLNASGGNMRGFQGAVGVNYSGIGQKNIQVAGLGNYSGGYTQLQLSGIANVADRVKSGQISTINVAREVEGFQLGLINFADTSYNASFGLINIIKRGYNKIEIGGSDVLHANIAAKLGTHRFYNIFHLGFRWDRLEEQGGDINTSWAVGYGIGTAFKSGERSLFDIELTALKVNSTKWWNRQHHYLSWLRMTYNQGFKNGLNIYAGPALYASFTEMKDEFNPIDLSPSRSPLYSTDNGSMAIKVWSGIHAGIRF